MDSGSGYELVDSLVTIYAVQPLILVDEERILPSIIPIGPRRPSIINAGSSISLGYLLNVDATWNRS